MIWGFEKEELEFLRNIYKFEIKVKVPKNEKAGLKKTMKIVANPIKVTKKTRELMKTQRLLNHPRGGEKGDNQGYQIIKIWKVKK